MLYNAKWDVVRVSDALSLDYLIRWLETKDPTTTYVYKDQTDCVLCRMLREAGHSRVTVGSTRVWYNDDSDDFCHLDSDLDVVAGVVPHDYGAALERARAIVSGRK